VWGLYDSFSLTLVGGAETSGLRNGLDLVSPPVLLYSWNVVRTDSRLLPSVDQVRAVFQILKSIQPDVVISGNRLPETCPVIVDIMNELNYQPMAIGVSQCITVDSVLENNDMRYFLDYSFWDPHVHGIAFTDRRDWDITNKPEYDSSSAFFNDTFYRVVGNIPNFYAAGTYVAGYAFEQALEKAQSLVPSELNDNFAFNLETTFWGNLGYNSMYLRFKTTVLTFF